MIFTMGRSLIVKYNNLNKLFSKGNLDLSASSG